MHVVLLKVLQPQITVLMRILVPPMRHKNMVYIEKKKKTRTQTRIRLYIRKSPTELERQSKKLRFRDSGSAVARVYYVKPTAAIAVLILLLIACCYVEPFVRIGNYP